MKDNIKDKINFNLKPSPIDERDYKLSDEVLGSSDEFQDFIINTKKDNKVYQQGSSSMCAGFGCAGYQSQLDIRRGLDYQRYSPVSLYANRFDEGEHQGEGQILRNIIKDWARSGVAKWEDAPFVGDIEDSIEYFKNISDKTKKDMLCHRINTFYRIDSKNAKEMYNTMVNLNVPILIGYDVYQSMTEGFHNGGVIPIPKDDESELGGHCSYICGTKQIKGKWYWMVVNSWGDNIFDDGIMYLPIEFNIWEAWVMFPKINREIIFEIDSDKYTINGENLTMDTTPVIINDRAYLPLRYIMESIDSLKVEWSESTKTASVYIGGDMLTFKIGDNYFTSHLQMKEVKFEEGSRSGLTKVLIDSNERTIIPIRAVSEFLGLTVEWVENGGKIIIRNFQEGDFKWA